MNVSRKKPERTIWQHRFNLSSDDTNDAALHAYLSELAERGDAAQWIRDTLFMHVPPKYNSGTIVAPEKEVLADKLQADFDRTEVSFVDDAPGPLPEGATLVVDNGDKPAARQMKFNSPVPRKIPAHIGRKTEGRDES